MSQIVPQPVPMNFEIMEARSNDGSVFVVLKSTHIMGETVMFFHPDDLDKIVEGLQSASRQAKTGLVAPSNGSGLIIPGQLA